MLWKNILWKAAAGKRFKEQVLRIIRKIYRATSILGFLFSKGEGLRAFNFAESGESSMDIFVYFKSYLAEPHQWFWYLK